MASNERATPVDGQWYPTNSNRFETVTLELVGKELLIRDHQQKQLCHAPVEAIVISARVGGIARELTFPDGSLFTSFDNDAIDRLLALTGHKKSRFIADLERFRPRLLVFILVAVALIYGAYRVSIPAFIEMAVYATPKQIPDAMGKSTFAALERTMLSPSEIPESRQKDVRALFDRLVSKTPEDHSRFRLYFRQAPDDMGPNAFALPDGRVVITDELITFAGDDDAMIAGVLAHEIAHVERQHSLRQIYRAAGMSALIMFVTGDMGELLERILLEGNVLLSLSYSRAAEAEADLVGVKLMMDAGYDPEALARFFEQLTAKIRKSDEDDNQMSIFDTHPGDKNRVSAIRGEINRLKSLLSP
ncbi:M48 family metallopeptidase [Bartonella sp. LJL80]